MTTSRPRTGYAIMIDKRRQQTIARLQRVVAKQRGAGK